MLKSQRIFLVGVSLVMVFFILLGCAPNAQGGFTCILVPAINQIRSYLPSSSNQTQPKTSAGTQSVTQPPLIIVFNSSPAEIAAGHESTLEWEVSGTATVSISPGVGSVDRVGTARVSPTADTVYTLTAANSAGMVTRTVSVRFSAASPPPVQAPPPSAPQPPAPQPPLPTPQFSSPGVQMPLITLFNASPASVTAGSCSALSWLVSGATSVSISPGIGSVPASGGAQACPGSTTTYTLNASNSAGSVQRTVIVYVSAPAPPPTPPPPATAPVINSFTASPASVAAGACSTLSWNTTGATSATVTPGGAQPVNGSVPACPVGTTTYTLTATNAAGSVTSPATVTITGAPPPPGTPPVINSFTASPASVAAGACSTLSWNTTGATSATVTPGGAQPVNGSAPACPAGTTTYTLTATNAAGSVTSPATVTITGAPPPPPADDATCEQALFDAVNALRAADGKAALTRNAYMDGLCRQHAQYMANLNVLSHDNFNARANLIWANVPGTNPVAENVLQANIPCDASYMANMWFNSPGHKTNMLNAAYNISGMGIVIDTNGKIWACQLFAGP